MAARDLLSETGYNCLKEEMEALVNGDASRDDAVQLLLEYGLDADSYDEFAYGY
jgi:hypothetical protein